MSTPLRLHWGLFGGWKLSDLNKRCHETWHAIYPNAEFVEWNENNGPKGSRFFREATECRPVNASNLIRFWALHEQGGIFMDNDVELLKPFDLTPNCFLAFQRDDTEQDCINTAILGSARGHPFIKRCLDRIEQADGSIWPVWPACTVPTEELTKLGMKGLNVDQVVADVRVYPKHVFNPWRHDEKPDRSRITDQTIAVHLLEGSWG
jgi:mannosyltransferase OCH1-like enzyme